MLIAAKCTQCGADIQLDDKRETGFCMYCGTTIIVKEAIQTVKIDNTKNIENYKRIADTSFEAGNYQDAYNYYSKILEENFDNWYAIYKRGLCSAWQSNLSVVEKTFPSATSFTSLMGFSLVATSFRDILRLSPFFSDLLDFSLAGKAMTTLCGEQDQIENVKRTPL